MTCPTCGSEVRVVSDEGSYEPVAESEADAWERQSARNLTRAEELEARVAELEAGIRAAIDHYGVAELRAALERLLERGEE